MRTVVTGGAGFAGSHLIEALLARGDEVTCVERIGAPRNWLDGRPVAWHPIGLEDEAKLASLVGGADVVFHLAALTEGRTPRDCYRVNTEGTAHLLRAIADSPGQPPLFVFMSSLAAAGPGTDGTQLDARTVPCPLSHYGQSKLLAESAVHAWADHVPSTILRFPAVYGPRDVMVLKLFRMIEHGMALTVGAWDRQLSLVYVADAVSGLLAAASPAATGRTYCVAYPESLTWGDFVETAGDALGRRPVKISLPAAAGRAIAVVAEGCARLRGQAAQLNRDRIRELTGRSWVCDPAPAMSDLGFVPAWPLERGIDATVAWARGQKWLRG
jgi:nucleoside-diphosphate-sugar epimerase